MVLKKETKWSKVRTKLSGPDHGCLGSYKFQGHVSQHQSQDHLRPLLRKPRAEDQSTWRSKGGWKMEWKNLRSKTSGFPTFFFCMNFNDGFVYWPYFAGKYSYSNLNWLGPTLWLNWASRMTMFHTKWQMCNQFVGWARGSSWQFLVQLGICYIIASAWMVSKHDYIIIILSYASVSFSPFRKCHGNSNLDMHTICWFGSPSFHGLKKHIQQELPPTELGDHR